MNPFYQYQVITSSLVSRAHCPHCQHRFQVMRRDSQRELTCLKCGKKFKNTGQKRPVRQIKKDQ